GLVEHLGRKEQLLAPGGALVHVDRREDAPVGQVAVEHDLAVAGALELLEDHLVAAAAGVDQRGGDDGEAAGAAAHLARAPEEALRLLQRAAVDTAREHAAGAALGGVVGARQARSEEHTSELQ